MAISWVDLNNWIILALFFLGLFFIVRHAIGAFKIFKNTKYVFDNESDAKIKPGYYVVKIDADDFYDEPDATDYVLLPNGDRRLDG